MMDDESPGLGLDEPEQPGLLIARLCLAGDGAHFDVAEAKFGQRLDPVALLVESGSQPERRREGQAERLRLQGGRCCRKPLQQPSRTHGVDQPDSLETDLVGAFGVHP